MDSVIENSQVVPFVDLVAQYNSIKEEIDTAVSRILETGSFIGGQEISNFENSFAKYTGAQYCIACANGTDAIEIMLKAAGIGQGDEVIVPCLTWISSAEAVNNIGAKPVFAMVEPDFYHIDPTHVEKLITPQTKAIIAVHLYGQPADIESLDLICKKYGLLLFEDCAQAHGAKFDGVQVGNFGIAGSFSFYPGKNLGAYGDAGCIVTNDENLASLAYQIGHHGQSGKKHVHHVIGRNSRLDTLQAAILNVKLPYLDSWTKARQNIAKKYNQELRDRSHLTLPRLRPNTEHAFHLYVVKLQGREKLKAHMKEKGVASAVHYPTPLPLTNAYRSNENPDKWRDMQNLQDQILSLPIYPEMTDSQLEKVCNCISKD